MYQLKRWGNKPSWNYLLKTYVNVCGKCGEKQMKFQYMENRLTDMEKQRMDTLLNCDDGEADTYKEHSKPSHPMKDTESRILKGLETLPMDKTPTKDWMRLIWL